MAETPEEVAHRLCPLRSHPIGAWSPSPDCRCKAISSALRAQYVAGLEAGALECDDMIKYTPGIPSNLRLATAAARIRELAEQVKREGT